NRPGDPGGRYLRPTGRRRRPGDECCPRGGRGGGGALAAARDRPGGRDDRRHGHDFVAEGRASDHHIERGGREAGTAGDGDGGLGRRDRRRQGGGGARDRRVFEDVLQRLPARRLRGQNSVQPHDAEEGARVAIGQPGCRQGSVDLRDVIVAADLEELREEVRRADTNAEPVAYDR